MGFAKKILITLFPFDSMLLNEETCGDVGFELEPETIELHCSQQKRRCTRVRFECHKCFVQQFTFSKRLP